jgi:hemolysin III
MVSVSDQTNLGKDVDAVYAGSHPWAEERLNAATHAFGAFLGVVGLVLLVMQADRVGRPDSLPAAIVYGTALVLLVLFSALHHAVLRPRIKHILLSLDHGGIYLLIAGTYTPFCLLIPRDEEWTLLALVWGLAMLGIAIQVASFLTRRSAACERIAFVSIWPWDGYPCCGPARMWSGHWRQWGSRCWLRVASP